MHKKTFVNEYGNTVDHSFFENRERYHYDFGECSGNGWMQYDTDQDAWYYGVWVNADLMMTLTFAEGDEYRVKCNDIEGYRKEIEHLNVFHGPPPPAYTVIDFDNKTVTKYYEDRPKV